MNLIEAKMQCAIPNKRNFYKDMIKKPHDIQLGFYDSEKFKKTHRFADTMQKMYQA